MPTPKTSVAKRIAWLIRHRDHWDLELKSCEEKRLRDRNTTRLRLLAGMMLRDGLYSPNTRQTDIAIGLPRLLKMARKVNGE